MVRNTGSQSRWKTVRRVFGGIVILLVLQFLWFDALNIYLLTLSSNNAKQVPYVITQLKSPNARRRATAAQALGNIGKRAANAIPDLVTALNDESPEVAAHAAWALGMINGIWSNQRIASPFITPVPPRRDSIDALTKALDHRDGEVRRYAAYALSFYGPQARSAIPKLTERLSDKHMAYMAALALGEMGPYARDSIPSMAALLVSSNPGDRAGAADALSKLSPLSDETVAAIAMLTTDDQDFVRDTARRATEKIRGSRPLPTK